MYRITVEDLMDFFQRLLNQAATLKPAQVCQGFYILASAAILALSILPAHLRSALMDYGARQEDSEKKKGRGFITSLIGLLEVPHSWFYHYYILSVALSAFWAWQYLTQGSFMRTLAEAQVHDGEYGMEISRVYTAWGLMTMQGLRRIYESIYVTKPGSSPMLSLHWLMGLIFYADMSISVWIEGSGKFQ